MITVDDAVPAIIAIRKKHNLTAGRRKPKTDINDSIKCPVCSRVLSYSISSYNGHIWGKCKTPGCLAWME